MIKSKKAGPTKRLRQSTGNLPFISLYQGKPTTSPTDARVVEWQTRTFEGRMPKGVGVQVPPRSPIRTLRAVSVPIAS